MGILTGSFLLDTHVLLWWFTDDTRLSTTARRAIEDRSNEVYVSAVSAWEIATKTRLGKLTIGPEVVEKFGELSASAGFTHLHITHRHGLLADGFEVSHRDPFDRMLAAQSSLEELPLISRDRAFEQFDIQVLWW